jgi:hypothetical protein
MPRGGKREGAGRPPNADRVYQVLADPQVQLVMLIMRAVADDDTRMALANLIDRYARDRRAKNSKPFKSITVALDGMMNPRPLITEALPLLVDDSWRELLPSATAPIAK